jgi:hypothetical protein
VLKLLWPFLIAPLLWSCTSEDPVATQMKQKMSSRDQSANTGGNKVFMTYQERIDSRKFGLAPDPNLDGKTLAQILTSQVAGRDDAQLCSACHNKDDAQGGYGVPVAKNGSNPGMKATDMIGLYTWCGPGGWADRFVATPSKPANLKAVIRAWRNNKCQ